MPLALLALAIGAFGIGTTEFVIMGLLPEVAGDFGVSIPTAGYLVTGYALGVMFGAPLMTVLGTRISRKRMLMLLMGLFVAGNLLSALAPSFGLMLTGRVVASLAHGAFFGIGSVVAADLVAPDKKAGAIALMFTGLTVANVVGVPLGTLVGQSIGWRVTFGIVAALGVVGLAGIARLVPDMPKAEGVRLRHELAALKNVQVLLAMAMTVLGFGGVFAAITYIAPMMTHVAGFADGSVTWLLVLFGLGMVGGNLIGGRYADRALMPMLYLSLGALAVVLALFTLTAHNKIAAAVTIALIGALGFATVPPLQKRVLDQAHGAPTLASALNIGAFNLGNALSAWLGGLVIGAGLGYTAPNWIGAVLAASALVLAFVSAALERRGTPPGTVLAGPAPAGPGPSLRPPVPHPAPSTSPSTTRRTLLMSTTTAVAPLTTAEAEALVSAAYQAADTAGVTVSVTVLDAGGHLLAFRRDDRAVLISGETSTRKAYTALQLNAPTADLVDAVQPGGLFHTLPTALDRPLLFIAGGVPVRRDGRLIGAIGVGGGAPEQDHVFATAAVEALV